MTAFTATPLSSAAPQIKAFFDPATWTVSYVVYDHAGGQCAIVDSVLDYDPKAGRTSTTSADALMAFVKEQGLRVQWILETHAHADHLSAAHYLRKHLGGHIAIGAAITQVQNVFKGIFNLEPEFHPDGSQFDHLFAPDEAFAIGTLRAQALAVPGHTPACMAFKVDGGGEPDAVFVWATPCSCPTWAPPAATSPAAMPTPCTAACSRCSPCRRTPASTCATTTRPKAAKPRGRARWRPSARPTSTSAMA